MSFEGKIQKGIEVNDIVLGIIKGVLEGGFLLFNYLVIWLYDIWELPFWSWVDILFWSVVICCPVITALLLTIFPKRERMLKSILIRDAIAAITFIISMATSIFTSPLWINILDRMHESDTSNAWGMLYGFSLLINLVSMVGTEVLILLVTSIVTLIAAQKNKKEKQSADQPERNEE